MKSFKVKVGFEEGIHARPAAELVSLLKNIDSEVTMASEEVSVNPKSILGLLTLGAKHGDALSIDVEGPDEEAVANSLIEFFGNAE